MANSGYLYTTVHYDGVHTAPLPVREKNVGAACGSVVVQQDWAYLADSLIQRCHSGLIPDSLNAYPHNFETVNGASASVKQFDEYIDTLRANAEFYFIEPSYIPQAFSGQWNAPQLVRYAPYPLHRSPRRPRSLDTMRRLFYDLKRMSRWICHAPHEYQDDFGDWRTGYGPTYSCDPNGDETLWDPQANRRQTTALDNIPAAVRSHANWRIAPAYGVVQFQAYKSGGAYQYKFIVVTQNSDGSFPTAGWTSSDCKAFATACGLSGPNTYANARVVGSYYDCQWPLDPSLAGWTWQPS